MNTLGKKTEREWIFIDVKSLPAQVYCEICGGRETIHLPFRLSLRVDHFTDICKGFRKRHQECKDRDSRK